jgi:hypothetical protein
MSRKTVLGLLVLGLILGSAIGARAQTYDLSWFTIAGGGGTSTGGTYTVSGTIGQSDAGHMSGGNYTLDGGFWSLFAVVQTPGAPRLSITLSNLSAIVSWPAPATGFYLQQNPAVNQSANWTSNSLPAIIVVNGTNTVTVPATGGPKYFRLKQ